MHQLTVKSLLELIFENNLQMEDAISFALSNETHEVGQDCYEISHVETAIIKVKGRHEKTLGFVFDLNEVAPI